MNHELSKAGFVLIVSAGFPLLSEEPVMACAPLEANTSSKTGRRPAKSEMAD